MTSISILASSFFMEERARGRENSLLILGQESEDFLRAAAAGTPFHLLKAGEAWPEDELLLIQEAACGMTEEVLFRFVASEQEALEDYRGKIAAIRLRGEALQLLNAEPLDAFDQALEQWELGGFHKEKDPVLDELVLDIPVVDSYLTLSLAEKQISQQICYDWMEKGVRIDEPTLVRIAPQVTLSEGVWIQGPARLMGATSIGPNTQVIGASIIENSWIGAHVRIHTSVLEEALMEDGSNIGPYGHLRPGASIGPKVHIGNFVEVKKARLEEGTKAGHLAYIGDATVGKNVNISCGVIFCNYDGKNKFHSTVGDDAFLGSNANLVAPVEIESGGYVAAGSTITKPVGAGELAVERAEQKNIPGYVDKRKKKGLL